MTNLAICDVNSYYCSCETAFRADLAGRGIVVAGNNDGIAVSRSGIAKQCIPMGAPIFQYRQIIEQKGIVVFSSNYALYHEFSQRIHSIMARYADAGRCEEFSIDESFIALNHIAPADRAAAMQDLRATILQETNIPVSIGVASIKVLGKLAADKAQVSPDGVRVF